MLQYMAGFQTEILVNGTRVTALADILPNRGPLKMLIVAKTPAPVSVAAGHYFQGSQGTAFWNRLTEHGILAVPSGKFHDEALLKHGYGLTDVVKVPRGFGNEPSDEEYRQGVPRILKLVADLRPTVLMLVYKRVLDNVLRLGFGRRAKSVYGFNPRFDPLFGARVFVFPMPGTPCTREVAHAAMSELAVSLR